MELHVTSEINCLCYFVVLAMLLMPFLSELQLKELEREGISGIDLCGNCVVVYPGTFSVFRSGAKNRFPSSALIKNIYRKNSSMVGDFLFIPPFRLFKISVQQLTSEISW